MHKKPGNIVMDRVKYESIYKSTLPNGNSSVFLVDTMQGDQCAKHQRLNHLCEEMAQGSDSILLLSALEDAGLQDINC